MSDDINSKVRKALADLTSARSNFLESLEISDPNPAPTSASEEDVAHLEQVIGRHLPPSCRAFLLLQNGLFELDGETHLLTVDEMIAQVGGKAAKLLNDIEEASGQGFIKHCIVFGRSDQSTSAFLFNPEQQNNEGEWKVIEFDEEEGIDATHESFLDFIVVSAAEAQAAEQEIHESSDLLDMDF